MENRLKGRRVAILATDGVEQDEIEAPRRALDAAGAIVHVIAPEGDSIQAMDHDEKGARLPVDRKVSEVRPSEYDALLLPGGVANPDRLRLDAGAVRFVREFMLSDRAVAAICHGAWMLVEAGAVGGRTLTSWPSLATDIRNAGGEWVDETVCIDDNLITSRSPEDLPGFCVAMVTAFSQHIDVAPSDARRELGIPAGDPASGSAMGSEDTARR